MPGEQVLTPRLLMLAPSGTSQGKTDKQDSILPTLWASAGLGCSSLQLGDNLTAHFD